MIVELLVLAPVTVMINDEVVDDDDVDDIVGSGHDGGDGPE